MAGTDQGAFTSSDGLRFDALGGMAISPAANDFALVTSTGGATEVLVAGGFGVGATPLSSLAPAATWSARSGPASVAAGGANARLNNVSTWDTAVIGSTLFATVSTNHYRDVLASADGGATWTSTGISAVLSPLDTPTQLLADAANGVLYVASSQGLHAYTPSGSRWVTVGATAIGAVSALSLGSTHVFVGTDAGLFAVARVHGFQGARLTDRDAVMDRLMERVLAFSDEAFWVRNGEGLTVGLAPVEVAALVNAVDGWNR